MREETGVDQRALNREQALLRYGLALERGDMETVATVLHAAEGDPILEQNILEMHDVYTAEYAAVAHEQGAVVIRELLHKHLRAAWAADEADSAPLTVGDVAARLQADVAAKAAVDDETLNVSRRLSAMNEPLPDNLNQRSVRELFERLGLQASDRFRMAFHDTAIFLSMGRQHDVMRLAAARRQREQDRQRRGHSEGSSK